MIACRTHRLRVCSLAAPIALLAIAACEPDEPPQPSVVLVVIDALRRDHLSLYGYAKETSPGLSRLAEESAVFERCLATSSWTKPSTLSLLSGLYPPSHGGHRGRKASSR